MNGAQQLVDEIEGRLQPLELELAEAWWESNTESSAEADQRRIAAELARAARCSPTPTPSRRSAPRAPRDATDGDRAPRRRLDLLHDAFVATPGARGSPARHRRARDRGGVHVQHLPWHDRRSPRRRQHDRRDPAHERRRRRAPRGVGGGASRSAPRSRTTCGSSLACATSAARDLGYRDHFALALPDRRARRGRVCSRRSPTSTGRPRPPFTDWKRALDEPLADALRCRRRRAPPVAPRRPVLPGRARRGCDRARRPLRRRRPRGAHHAHLRRPRARRATACSTHSDLYARDGKSQHAFCIDIDREGDVRVLCNVEPNERWMETMLHEFGHAVYDRERDRDAPVARARRRAHAHHRGHRDAVRPARPRSRRGSARSPASTRRRPSTRCARGSPRRGAPSCSCSRAGCS